MTSTTSTTTTATIDPGPSASSVGGEGEAERAPGDTVGALTGPVKRSALVMVVKMVTVVVPVVESGPRHALASLRLTPVCVAQNSATFRFG